MGVQTILNQVEEALVSDIPAAVACTFLMEPLYAVLIDYFHWDFSPPEFELDSAPPLVIAAPVSVRRAIMNGHEYPDCVQWDAGYVAEETNTRIALQFPVDGASAVHCSALYKSLDEGDERSGAMLQRVAARLNNVDWHAIADITDDFIVCVQDSHGEHNSQKDIEASVSPERIALLQSRGWLWKWLSSPAKDGELT